MSLQGYLNENSVVNSIRLQLRHPSGAEKVWIIVEGETDQKLFSKLLNGDHAEIEVSYGGVNGLLKIVSVLLKETNRILDIRDADFLNLEKKIETNKNIFLTDFHDIEMMIISCDPPYNSVISEYLREEKHQSALRKKILKSIAFLGGIRWINQSENLELNFNKIGLGNFYNGQTASLDEDKCLSEILRRSPNKKRKVSAQDVKFKINGISDYLNLCNGHDFQKAFALCVSFTSKKGINDMEIGRAFRLAYRFDDFQKSNLYRHLKNWADNQSKLLFKHKV
ncbi:DUF4435 [Desulfonema limicola]|uniref:DUF4435 n=1 Tax=Desulfonema limicola TaxID=45656 RepID=A0A975B6T9_9BACT|nr:DUF4435 domain-containing protein [Desulfonema limicola]QTA79924.1 DUF4435 [Desulfonema limicola]